MKRHRATWGGAMLACVLASCAGEKGPAGPKGDPGQPGAPGAPGAPASTTGILAGSVTDSVAGDPLSGVVVTAADSAGAVLGTATTGADGRFALTVVAGPMEVSFQEPFHTSPSPLPVGVIAGRTLALAVTLSESGSGRPSVSIAAPGNDVGYGATVQLTATASDPNGDALTYAWSNATSPALGAVSGAGATGSVAMPTLAEAFAFRADPGNPGQFVSGYRLEDRLGVLPITGDARGQVIATVTVLDGRGQSASASLTLSAASVSPGLRDVAVGTRVYLNSGHDAGNAWSLTAVPGGSSAALDDATSRTPSFVADVAGEYDLSESAGALILRAGSWRGMIAGGSGDTVAVESDCTLCHQGTIAPDVFTPWRSTGHATQLTRGIDGKLGASYSASCVECHSVGYDTGAFNGGFDDAATAAGWTFPTALLSTNWEEMLATAPTVARLANVQCESCHGPQNSVAHTLTWVNGVSTPFLSPRVSYAAEACAPCHGSGAHHIYSEWATPAAPDASGVAMGHSNRTAATTIGSGPTGLNASCGRCHTAQGYGLYVGLLLQGKVALNSVPASVLAQVTAANAEPVTCSACHDPHDATNPNQLRLYGDTPLLPSGFAGHGLGKGAVCVSCHNSRNGVQTGSDALTYLHEDGEPYNAGNPTGYSAPHQACQGDVFAGRNAYFLGASLPMTSRHAAVQDTCVGCHMELQPEGYLAHGAPARSGHLFRILDQDRAALCSGCHGSNVDGEGIQAQVEAQLDSLAAALGAAAKARMNAIAGGVIRVRAWDGATDLYSSTSASNVAVDVVANPVSSVGVEEIHGQVGLVVTLTTPVTIPFVDASGQPAGSKTMSTFGVQLGALKDGQATPAVLYGLTGNFVRAGWNYFLVHGDASKGLHNPSFVTAVLNASVRRDLSN
ncbi:carboxypeptidase regulatory-like domain-containing protein [Anaeromyxobacter oryzae]|nr:carboxypeptidase regulatory-like domain-containing protein [Anaeromyxobacter oryzae]